MTSIPDYLTVLAMTQHAHEPHEIHAVRTIDLSHSERTAIRFRIASRFGRRSAPRADGPARTSAPARVLPEMRDYPFRSGC